MTLALRLAALLALIAVPQLAVAKSDLDLAALVPTENGHGASILVALQENEGEDDQSVMYEPEFEAFGRSILGRAPTGVTTLNNNVAKPLNVDPGSTQVFVFEKSSFFEREASAEPDPGHDELRRRYYLTEEDIDGPVKNDLVITSESSGSDDGSDGDVEDSNDDLDGDVEDSDDGSDGDMEDSDDGADGNVERQTSSTNSTRTVYLSANTCVQPQAVPNKSRTATSVSAPQLTMYISTSPNNTSPGPSADSSLQTSIVFTEGAVMYSLNATDDVYIGISAPNISSSELTGTYNFQVAASVDQYYHSFDNESDANLIWVDSDSKSALLFTHNLTTSSDAAIDDEIMSTPPYVMFAQNVENPSTNGVRLSYCGLQAYAQIVATTDGKDSSMVVSGMTRSGQGSLPKQQFYVSGLNASASYVGILTALPLNGSAAVGSNVAGGGGRVSRATNFTTSSPDSNCDVVFNLTFCNETAYAVPSNANRFANLTVLAQTYDDYAANMYANFEKVMAQVACEAPTTQRYSLVRSCEDCAAAYKSWLCSVVIPRCTDFNNDASYLQERAVAQPFPNGTMLDFSVIARYPNTTAYNSSRNAFISEIIAPGPYKEVLPCNDLCHNLVQSCPAEIGFSCPVPGIPGFNTSYGQRLSTVDGEVTCNYPGSAHYFSAGPEIPRPASFWLALVITGSLVMAIL